VKTDKKKNTSNFILQRLTVIIKIRWEYWFGGWSSLIFFYNTSTTSHIIIHANWAGNDLIWFGSMMYYIVPICISNVCISGYVDIIIIIFEHLSLHYYCNCTAYSTEPMWLHHVLYKKKKKMLNKYVRSLIDYSYILN
jgi:hypothetical protein